VSLSEKVPWKELEVIGGGGKKNKDFKEDNKWRRAGRWDKAQVEEKTLAKAVMPKANAQVGYGVVTKKNKLPQRKVGGKLGRRRTTNE